MPIEIRELIIKATVVQDGAPGGSGGGSNPSSNNGVSPNEEMINLCLEKLNEINKDKRER